MLAQPPASGMAFEQETAQARKTEGGRIHSGVEGA
jgi:hypothetical protein